MNQREYEAILSDDTKVISENIVWKDDDDHSPAKEFRIEVNSAAGHPIFVTGRFNISSGKLSYTIIHRGMGRIYGLDMGADHRNPDGNYVGEPHKHYWRQDSRDKWAYVPEEITEPWDRPLEVWVQFCAEAKLQHSGTILQPGRQFEWTL